MVVIALLLILCGTANAGWEPAREIARDAAPHAATGVDGGGIALLTNGETATRFTWSGATPDRALLPATLRTYAGTPWAANARGDVLLVGETEHRVQAVAVDATGARAAFAAPSAPETSIENVAAALGPDGTAIVAWTVETEATLGYRDVWVSVRPPGGAFGPVTVVKADGARALAVAVRADGTPSLAYEDSAGVYFAELPAGVPVRVAGVGVEVRNLALAGDRVLIVENDVRTVLRRPDGGWDAPQQIAGAGAWALGTPLAGLADGGAVVVYGEGRSVNVRRAGAGAAFGPAQRLARVGSAWDAYTFAAVTSTRGDALVTWNEASADDDLRYGFICGGACHERVVAAVASPGARFGAPRLVSPLAAVTGEYVAAAISDTGERLVAWQNQRDGSLSVARGAGAPEVAQRADRRPPRIVVRLGSLASTTVRARVRCNEACAVHVSVLAPGDEDQADLGDLAPVELSHAGSRTVTWRLTRAQQRALRRIRRFERVVMSASAVDAAGNRAALNRRLT